MISIREFLAVKLNVPLDCDTGNTSLMEDQMIGCFSLGVKARDTQLFYVSDLEAGYKKMCEDEEETIKNHIKENIYGFIEDESEYFIVNELYPADAVNKAFQELITIIDRNFK